MTKGLKKLHEVMKRDGYLEVSEKIGISKSLIIYLRNGGRDPQKMKLSTAKKFQELYGIDFLDWFKHE